ncbi:hypothetical protein ACET3Z_019861 [Daucus carota]
MSYFPVSANWGHPSAHRHMYTRNDVNRRHLMNSVPNNPAMYHLQPPQPQPHPHFEEPSQPQPLQDQFWIPFQPEPFPEYGVPFQPEPYQDQFGIPFQPEPSQVLGIPAQWVPLYYGAPPQWHPYQPLQPQPHQAPQPQPLEHFEMPQQPQIEMPRDPGEDVLVLNPNVSLFTAKTYIRWTGELEERFSRAVQELGGPFRARPKAILKKMKVQGLKHDHIKSHLQKVRSKARPKPVDQEPAVVQSSSDNAQLPPGEASSDTGLNDCIIFLNATCANSSGDVQSFLEDIEYYGRLLGSPETPSFMQFLEVAQPDHLQQEEGGVAQPDHPQHEEHQEDGVAQPDHPQHQEDGVAQADHPQHQDGVTQPDHPQHQEDGE